MPIERIPWPYWQVVQQLGQGSFGSVYEIRRDIFGSTERSALKVITIPTDPGEPDRLQAMGYTNRQLGEHYRSCMERLAGEYGLMVKMKGHPNIVYCDDFQALPHPNGPGWDIFIRMELLHPLLSVLSPGYDEATTVHLGLQMCAALTSCERRKILHRDIKPENVFLSRDGNFKLGDFGVARLDDQISVGAPIGTYDYMAPEVYHRQPYSFSCDQYSLGLMLYWLMNDRQPPFVDHSSRMPTPEEQNQALALRMGGQPLPPPRHGSRALFSIISRACAYRPEDRFLDAAQLQQALAQLPVPPLDLPILHRPSTDAPRPTLTHFRPPSSEDL